MNIDWVAMVQMIIEAIANCRQTRSRADVERDVKNPGPFAVWALRRKLLAKGLSRDEAKAVIDRALVDIKSADDQTIQEFIDEAESQAIEAGQPLFGVAAMAEGKSPSVGSAISGALLLAVLLVASFGSVALASDFAFTSPPPFAFCGVEAKKPVLPEVDVPEIGIPDAHPWVFIGGNHSAEALRRHLIEDANHKINPLYLEGLTLSELQATYSADHEGLLGDVVRLNRATSATNVSRAKTSTATSTEVAGVWRTTRSGLFGLRTRRLWVPNATKQRTGRVRRTYSSGCPGGVCPL